MKFSRHLREPFGALREDLIRMLRRLGNHFENILDIANRHLRMEQVTHAINEDCAWSSPAPGEIQGVGMERPAKSGAWRPRVAIVLILGLAHRLQSFGEGEGIAAVTPWARFVASSCWIPSRLCPLDVALVTHRRCTSCGEFCTWRYVFR